MYGYAGKAGALAGVVYGPGHCGRIAVGGSGAGTGAGRYHGIPLGLPQALVNGPEESLALLDRTAESGAKIIPLVLRIPVRRMKTLLC